MPICTAQGTDSVTLFGITQTISILVDLRRLFTSGGRGLHLHHASSCPRRIAPTVQPYGCQCWFDQFASLLHTRGISPLSEAISTTPPLSPAPSPSSHPGGNPGANLKSISHRCQPILVAFVWELTKETIYLPRCSGAVQVCTPSDQLLRLHPPIPDTYL